MKESDLCVIAVVYGVATWFLVMTLQLPPAAQSYPLILLTALYLCNTLFLGKQLYSFYRHRVFLTWLLLLIQTRPRGEEVHAGTSRKPDKSQS